MPPDYFPLRWESTGGDQWWFASPIDWAAANGHYGLVRELINRDTNLFFKLTSLARIRRLETVWEVGDDGDDDDDEKFNDVARCRSKVARNLLRDCETLKGYNSLIRAGYGGWLLYTAAAAGDLVFVKELLGRDPLLVFGEGEYGVTDMLYAAGRSRSGEVFRVLFDCCLSVTGRREEDASPEDFRFEMINRAVHAAARGGNLGILTELLGDGSDVLDYRDSQGSTVLHSAAGRGQVKVVNSLISSYDIITSIDNRGNTALNVAAYHGHLPVVELLISAAPSSVLLTNNDGDTFLHMAVSGFDTPSFRRLDRHRDLLKKLADGTLVNLEDIINVQNSAGRTVLHMAVTETIPSDIVELIMSVQYIDVNIRDGEGNTPLDLVIQRPKTASSEILIKRLISTGGVFSKGRDLKAGNAFVCDLRLHSVGGSPGTSFRIPDSEIIWTYGIGDTRRSSCELASYSGEFEVTRSSTNKKLNSINSRNGRFRNFLRWLGKKKDRTADGSVFEDDSLSFRSYAARLSDSPVPLRQQYSRMSSFPERIHSLQGNLPSPSSEKKFASRDVRGVLLKSNRGSPCSAFSESSWPSPLSSDKGVSVGPTNSNRTPNLEKSKMKRTHGSFNLRSMNNYFCLGSRGGAVEQSISLRPLCQDE